MPSEASAKEGRPLHYVYLLQSLSHVKQRYVGCTDDLRARMRQHNAGESPYTSKCVPWRIVTYMAFSSREQAESFEKYLKSGSGHAFAQRRLW